MTHVALLRGVNVGRAKRVAMADIRTLVTGLGYAHVRTLLNSGNVLFEIPPEHGAVGAGPAAAQIAQRVEVALGAQLGLTSRVTVLAPEALAAVVTENPLGAVAVDPSRLFAAVLRDPARRAALDAFADRDWGAERLAVGTRAAYLWCPSGLLESPLTTAVARALGDEVTTRNWATVTKLYALASGQR